MRDVRVFVGGIEITSGWRGMSTSSTATWHASGIDNSPRHDDTGQMPTVYFSTKEAADYLKVRPERVLDLIEEGRFPGAVKIGNRWQIPADGVIHFQKRKPGRPKKRPGRPRNQARK